MMSKFIRTRNGLIVPQTHFAETSGKPVFGEIATTNDGRDITRGYVDNLPILPPADPVLQARGGGDFRVYEEILRDDQVGTALQQRKLALIGKEWTVEPASNQRRDQAAADFIREQLERIDFDSLTRKMLSGVFYGYAVAEVIYARDSRFVVLDALKVKKQRRFGFSPEGELRLLTSRNFNGEALPPRKFWAYRSGADDDDEPYGLGLAHWLYWPVFFKRNGIKFWLIFLEKFGQPTALGKYPVNATQEEKDKLLEALSAVHTDSGIRIPEAMQIELIEASRSGTTDYTELYDRMNQAISKIILGHTGSTDATAGRLGGEDLAGEVRAELVRADADLICNSFNQTVVAWLTDWNFPDAAPPKVWRDLEESEDLKSRADRDKVIFDMGFRPVLKYITETYGGEWVEQRAVKKPDESAAATTYLAESACPCCGGRHEFAEGATPGFPDQTALEKALDALDGGILQEQMEAILKPVLQLAETAPDQLLGRLAELYPELDDAGLQNQLARLIFVAQVWGRLNA